MWKSDSTEIRIIEGDGLPTLRLLGGHLGEVS